MKNFNFLFLFDTVNYDNKKQYFSIYDMQLSYHDKIYYNCGCGSAVNGVASNTRDPGFKCSHQEILLAIICIEIAL